VVGRDDPITDRERRDTRAHLDYPADDLVPEHRR